MQEEPEPSSLFTGSCYALPLEKLHHFQKEPSNPRRPSFSLLPTVVGENSESQAMKPTAILISLLTSLNRDHNKISGFLFGYGSANNDNHQGHQVGEGCSSFLPSDVMVCCSAFPS